MYSHIHCTPHVLYVFSHVLYPTCMLSHNRCWICGEDVGNAVVPKHYSDNDSPCNNRQFDGNVVARIDFTQLSCCESVTRSLHTLTIHSLYTHSTLTIHSLYTHYTLTTHSLYTHHTLTTRSLHTHYTFTTHSLHTHYTLTTHSLHTHYTFTAQVSPW
jgi:hypothetical protein